MWWIIINLLSFGCLILPTVRLFRSVNRLTQVRPYKTNFYRINICDKVYPVGVLLYLGAVYIAPVLIYCGLPPLSQQHPSYNQGLSLFVFSTVLCAAGIQSFASYLNVFDIVKWMPKQKVLMIMGLIVSVCAGGSLAVYGSVVLHCEMRYDLNKAGFVCTHANNRWTLSAFLMCFLLVNVVVGVNGLRNRWTDMVSTVETLHEQHAPPPGCSVSAVVSNFDEIVSSPKQIQAQVTRVNSWQLALGSINLTIIIVNILIHPVENTEVESVHEFMLVLQSVVHVVTNILIFDGFVTEADLLLVYMKAHPLSPAARHSISLSIHPQSSRKARSRILSSVPTISVADAERNSLKSLSSKTEEIREVHEENLKIRQQTERPKSLTRKESGSSQIPGIVREQLSSSSEESKTATETSIAHAEVFLSPSSLVRSASNSLNPSFSSRRNERRFSTLSTIST